MKNKAEREGDVFASELAEAGKILPVTKPAPQKASPIDEKMGQGEKVSDTGGESSQEVQLDTSLSGVNPGVPAPVPLPMQVPAPMQVQVQAPKRVDSQSASQESQIHPRVAESPNPATARAGLNPGKGSLSGVSEFTQSVPRSAEKSVISVGDGASSESGDDLLSRVGLENEALPPLARQTPLDAASMSGARGQRGDSQSAHFAPRAASSRNGLHDVLEGRGEADERAVFANASPVSRQAQRMGGAGEVFPVEGASLQLGHPIQQGLRSGGALSGGDFLSTLNSVQGQAVTIPGSGSPMGMQADSSGERGGFSRNGNSNTFLSPNSHIERFLSGGSRSKKSGSLLGIEEGGKALGLYGGGAAQSGQSQLTTAATPTMTGNVTQGAMAKDRLSSESLLGLSAGIRNLTQQGGGEIHVRLNPENLGELHLKVVTQGNQVGLQIQASDDKAKKVLEESLSHLRDGLASHQLSLKSVEFTVAGAQQGSQGENPSGHPQQQNPGHAWSPIQPGLQDLSGGGTDSRNPGGFGGRFNSDSFADSSNRNSRVGNAPPSPGLAFGRSRDGSSANGRIDVMA